MKPSVPVPSGLGLNTLPIVTIGQEKFVRTFVFLHPRAPDELVAKLVHHLRHSIFENFVIGFHIAEIMSEAFSEIWAFRLYNKQIKIRCYMM